MLAERLAALIIGHEPGWRLPRPTALARRFNVTVLQIECAIRELVRRRLVRQLPDGSMYRASPADYHIALEGIPGIGAAIDPMGASITCTSRHVSWRRIPEDIALILGLLPAVETSVIRCHWAANGYRAALSTTYLASRADLADSSSPKDTEPLDAVFSLASPAILGHGPGRKPSRGHRPGGTPRSRAGGSTYRNASPAAIGRQEPRPGPRRARDQHHRPLPRSRSALAACGPDCCLASRRPVPDRSGHATAPRPGGQRARRHCHARSPYPRVGPMTPGQAAHPARYRRPPARSCRLACGRALR